MKRIWLSIFFCFVALIQSRAQRYFKLSDSTFSVGQIYIPDSLFFNFDGGFPLCSAQLDSLKSFVYCYPQLSFRVYVYTDSRGDNQFNQKLTETRAGRLIESLCRWEGDQKRFKGIGMGESEPRLLEKDVYSLETKYLYKAGTIVNDDFLTELRKNTGDTIYEEGCRFNRRVKFEIISIKGGTTINRPNLEINSYKYRTKDSLEKLILPLFNLYNADYTLFAYCKIRLHNFGCDNAPSPSFLLWNRKYSLLRSKKTGRYYLYYNFKNEKEKESGFIPLTYGELGWYLK